jgi:hypothetical protein
MAERRATNRLKKRKPGVQGRARKETQNVKPLKDRLIKK